jgi:hypothetical protein
LKRSGKPLDLGEYFSAPEDVRVSLSLLKESGFLPREVELLNEIASLEQGLNTAPEAKRVAVRKAIQEKRLALDLLMERSRSRSGRKRLGCLVPL